MNPSEYLEKSKNTLAEQDKEQRQVDNEALHDAMQLADAGNVCDMLKRIIFYKDENAIDRYRSQEAKITNIRIKIPPLSSVARELSQHEVDLLHAGLGLGSESGEIIEAVIDSIATGKEVDTVNIKEEVGDVLWYLAILCRNCDFTFEEAMQTNINKLTKRYSDKFNTTDAVERDLEEERKVLEG